MVWARGKAAIDECPTSFVTPASVELVEQYFAWKASVWGQVGASELTAREAEAFVMLEQEWRTERTNAQQ